jgi:hypothetical protein
MWLLLVKLNNIYSQKMILSPTSPLGGLSTNPSLCS